MVQYLSIEDWFEEGEKEEAEKKAKEAIGFATWLNTPFKTPNGNGSFDMYTRCIPQYPEFTLYIMSDNEGNLDRKTFYTIQELYQIYLNQQK